MKKLVCEMCGSQDLVKKKGMYVCQHCGIKYDVEEAKKMFGVVKIDRTEETQKLLLLARRAHEEGNCENAEKYYGMVLQSEPNHWEAAFFQVYYRAKQCKVGEISYYADAIAQALKTVSILLENLDQAEKTLAVLTIATSCCDVVDLFTSAAVNHCNKYRSVEGVFTECVNMIVNTSRIIGILEIMIKNYCTNKDVLISWQKDYVRYLRTNKDFFNPEYINNTITRLSNEIRQVDPSFAPPTNSGGCYVATAVYGSYDCPQVWTLRRFRDNVLAETWYGRAFVRTYYTISPTLVKWFGHTEWFKNLWRGKLNKMVASLQKQGIESTPYKDINW